jgi:seryl-tRNA synthetase
MIDLKYLQKNFDEASAKLSKKGVNNNTLQNLKTLFANLKEANAKLEEAKAEQNIMSKLFGEYMREKKDIRELK